MGGWAGGMNLAGPVLPGACRFFPCGQKIIGFDQAVKRTAERLDSVWVGSIFFSQNPLRDCCKRPTQRDGVRVSDGESRDAGKVFFLFLVTIDERYGAGVPISTRMLLQINQSDCLAVDAGTLTYTVHLKYHICKGRETPHMTEFCPCPPFGRWSSI